MRNQLFAAASIALLLSACASVEIKGVAMPKAMQAQMKGERINADSRFHKAIYLDSVESLPSSSGIMKMVGSDSKSTRSAVFQDGGFLTGRIRSKLMENGYLQQGMKWSATNLLTVRVVEYFDESNVVKPSAKNIVGSVLGYDPTESDYSREMVERGYFFKRLRINYRLENGGRVLLDKEIGEEIKVILYWKNGKYNTKNDIPDRTMLDRSLERFLKELDALEDKPS
jgi:hypothetical protein